MDSKNEVNESMVQETLQMMMSESRKQPKTKVTETKPPLQPRKQSNTEIGGLVTKTIFGDKPLVIAQEMNRPEPNQADAAGS